MTGDLHSRAAGDRAGSRVVYTDGACSGNPGPGGWAWVEVDGAWASGFDEATTNQRMEITAALAACERFAGPLVIVSDSTYVVHCWRDKWWEGWLRKGWRNSQRKDVANRDLWEPLVAHFRDRGDLELRWVKGHSGDRWNDVADGLAVRAIERREGASGGSTPGPEEVGPAVEMPRRTAVDRRAPAGHRVVVTGLRAGPLRDRKAAATAQSRLAEILAGLAGMHADVVVLTGLRAGAETLAAGAATSCGVSYAVVLPYPDPVGGWPEAERAAFEAALSGAREVVVLERARPADAAGRRAALARRDGWLRKVGDAAVVLTDGADAEAEDALARFEAALAEDVWRLDVTPLSSDP